MPSPRSRWVAGLSGLWACWHSLSQPAIFTYRASSFVLTAQRSCVICSLLTAAERDSKSYHHPRIPTKPQAVRSLVGPQPKYAQAVNC